MPGQLGRLAAEDRAAGLAADVGRALDELGDLLHVDRVGSDVVEEEQRLGSRREHVVDAVRGEIRAAPAKAVAAAAQHELRADRVGRRGQQAMIVDREEPRKRAERAGDPGRRSRGDSRAEPIDDRVGGRERDPGSGVRLLGRGHGTEPSDHFGSSHGVARLCG